MDTDHHKTLDAFKTEESSTQDTQLKPIVQKGEKVVAQHTAMADKMQTKVVAQHTAMADKMQTKMGGSSSGM